MRKALVALANRAHCKSSPVVRRGLLIVAVSGLALVQILFWLIATPLLIIFYPIIMGLVAFGKAAAEIPKSTVGQAISDIGEWRHDWPGIKRIWRAQKVETVIERASHER